MWLLLWLWALVMMTVCVSLWNKWLLFGWSQKNLTIWWVPQCYHARAQIDSKVTLWPVSGRLLHWAQQLPALMIRWQWFFGWMNKDSVSMPLSVPMTLKWRMFPPVHQLVITHNWVWYCIFLCAHVFKVLQCTCLGPSRKLSDLRVCSSVSRAFCHMTTQSDWCLDLVSKKLAQTWFFLHVMEQIMNHVQQCSESVHSILSQNTVQASAGMAAEK
jgi:hypothetical protein